jgi:hypothetical protein
MRKKYGNSSKSSCFFDKNIFFLIRKSPNSIFRANIRNLLLRAPTHGTYISTPPNHGILTPYLCYIDPPIHGISNPLTMVFWPPAYLLIRNEGGQYTIWHRSFLHSWTITGFVIRLTRWVPLVEQEQLTFLEHPSSVPVFSYTIFSFMCMLCRSLFVLLSCFAIVLSVLRFTDLISYYPFRLWYLETLLKKSCYSFPNRLLC